MNLNSKIISPHVLNLETRLSPTKLTDKKDNRYLITE